MVLCTTGWSHAIRVCIPSARPTRFPNRSTTLGRRFATRDSTTQCTAGSLLTDFWFSACHQASCRLPPPSTVDALLRDSFAASPLTEKAQRDVYTCVLLRRWLCSRICRAGVIRRRRGTTRALSMGRIVFSVEKHDRSSNFYVDDVLIISN
jgi:hypothetical protein